MKRAVLSFLVLQSTLLAWPSMAQVGISVSFGPPPLPVYAQPPCPADGYIWTPGYWAYDNYFGYYWVPGTWVLTPQPGLLWTPGWWGWSEGAFMFHEGYWAPQVGFYGGINYGFGFFGEGYVGGRWDGNHFYYNRAVSNLNNKNIHHVYNTTVVSNVTVNHISYNGGNGGIQARPTREQDLISRQHHLAPEPVQLRHLQLARANPQLRADVNRGKPAIAATARPTAFTGSHVVAARQAGGRYQIPEKKEDHASSVTAHQAPSPLRETEPFQRAPEHGIQERPEAQQRAQAPQQQQRQQKLGPQPQQQLRQQEPAQQQERQRQQEQALVDRQNQQHAQLQAQQEREHQQALQRNLNQQRQQQMEQRHAQQTAQMERQHMQQMQHVERPPTPNRPSAPTHPEPKPPHR